MVRQTKQTPEQKKESHKKKTTPREKPASKKPIETSIWPCTIDGCNKQFAREADLKRHQRTTKLHSVPGFACPQCDARFTRTDALRRHQKSRHNGVVVDPTDGVEKRRRREHARSSGSGSKSRSISPSSKENPHPDIPQSTSGPQSHYRQHTLPPGGMIPPGMIVDSNYPPVGLPTSAARLHQASWPPPWGGDGSQPPPPHMLPPDFSHPYYNVPPQYYRPGTMHPSDAVAHQQMSDGLGSPHTGESSSSRTGSPVMAVDPTLDPSRMEAGSTPEIGDPETAVIDPSLVSPSASSADGRSGNSSADNAFNLADHEPSVDPRVTSVSDTRRSSPRHGRHLSSHSHSSHGSPREEEGGTEDETTIVQVLLSPDHDPDPYPSPDPTSLDRPLDMEQILTEDGEPMLNPAELLTQESLASPPPS